MSTGPLMVDVAGTELSPDEHTMLMHPLVGGVILFTRNYADRGQLEQLTGAIRTLRPELLIAADYEGGRVQRFRDGFTRLPSMGRVGALYDQDHQAGQAVAEAVGWTIGSELTAAGVDLPLTPVLDLARGESAVIGDRAFHAETDVVVTLARALRTGLSAAGVAATGKHYPGHGAVRVDSHDDLPVDDRPQAALTEEQTPFAALIADGLESVMMAHIRYPAVDDRPASLSPTWIGERLRNQLQFDGAVFCDDLSMGGVASAGDYPERARAALTAGCDVLPVCNNPQAVSHLLDTLAHTPDPEAEARRAALKPGQALGDNRHREQALAQMAEWV